MSTIRRKSFTVAPQKADPDHLKEQPAQPAAPAPAPAPQAEPVHAPNVAPTRTTEDFPSEDHTAPMEDEELPTGALLRRLHAEKVGTSEDLTQDRPGFTVKSRELTQKTTVYDVVLGNHPVASTGNEEAANRIADYFTKHQIYDLATYKAMSNAVRLEFISATNQAQPNFLTDAQAESGKSTLNSLEQYQEFGSKAAAALNVQDWATHDHWKRQNSRSLALETAENKKLCTDAYNEGWKSTRKI